MAAARSEPTRRGLRLAAHLGNLWQLTVKELRSIAADPILLLLMVYTFTIAVYTVTNGASTEATNLSVGIVDEDRSELSLRLHDALIPPLFKPAVPVRPDETDRLMDEGRLVFVVEIPPSFQADLLAGRRAAIQVNADATAMTQAGNGSAYLQAIISDEVGKFLAGRTGAAPAPVNLVIAARFNPNLSSAWFTAIMQVINSITMLTLILTGAALIREREQGTVEHLLVMPVTPSEIVFAKMAANGAVILSAALLSLWLVVQGLLKVPVAGSLVLFTAGALLYQLSVGALGILIGTIARTMGQFGLLVIPVMVLMQLLSGSTTPLESMPAWLRLTMQVVSPTPHFVAFAQAVLYRGAGLSLVWQQLLPLAAIGIVYFAVAIRRFRRVIFES